MAVPTGQYFISGKDLSIYGIVVESGSDDFLKFPARKASTTHDWQDSNGIDVDLTLPFFEDKKISLKCAMFADTEEDFWRNYEAFIGEWARPGTRDWTVTKLGKTFQVYYKDCTDFERITKLKTVAKIATRFTLNLVEPIPNISEGNAYIVTEDGRFIAT